MKQSPSNASLHALTRLAATQGGYFTARQARQFGYLAPHLSYHAATGNFARAGHGVYRLPALPLSEHDDLLRLWLWSRARDDRPQAICSHQTALALHELSDAIPDANHLTVPRGFRRKPPPGCVLHTAQLQPGEIHAFDAVPVTTPRRTLADLAGDASLPSEQFERAARRALERGMIDRSELRTLLHVRRQLRSTPPSAETTA